jgi:tryptophan-rich hypothetical protein
MNSINPKKLLNSKWTAVNPVNREKHFMVTEVKFDVDDTIIHCLLEAIVNRRSFSIQWRELKDSSVWIAGWQ